MRAKNRSAAAALDRADPLAHLPARYQLPPGVIRLDGTGTGPWTETSTHRLRRCSEYRWERRGEHRWRGPGAQQRASGCDEERATAGKLAPLLGAHPDELTISESSPVNLFNALVAAGELRPQRPVLVVGHDCLATDDALARSAADFGGRELRVLARGQALDEALDERVAVVALSHTDLATGALRDPAQLSAEAHRRGALALLDLTHSAGALAVHLRAWGTDLAIGGGDKYLGGGPGAPAYSFVAERHRRALATDPARPGAIDPLRTGRPSRLSLSTLRAGLAALEGAATAALEHKANGLVELFLRRLQLPGATDRVELLSPSPDGPRGSEVLLRHPEAQRVADGLWYRGVLVTVIEPDVLRFSFAPSWLRYVDAWEAAELLREVLEALDRSGPLDRSGLSAPLG